MASDTSSSSPEQSLHRLPSPSEVFQAVGMPCLVPLKESGQRTPLFCIHCGTGEVDRYREMTSLLDSDQPVYGLRAPNLDGVMKIPTVEEFAQLYLTDIRRVQKHGPYQMCGLSFGGMVAFEIASQLMACGEDVCLLGLLDTGNPAFYRDRTVMHSLRFGSVYLLDRIQKYSRRLARFELRKMYSDIHQLISWQIKKIWWRIIRKRSELLHKPIPQTIEDKAVVFTTIGEAYTPNIYPGRVHLFRAKQRTKEHCGDLSLGWDRIVTGGVIIHNVPGDHISILQQPYVSALVKELELVLKKTS